MPQGLCTTLLGVRETFGYLDQTGKSIWSGHIIKVRIADLRLLIPEVHGVYGLSQFRAAGLVDTTSIGPEIVEAIFYSRPLHNV